MRALRAKRFTRAPKFSSTPGTSLGPSEPLFCELSRAGTTLLASAQRRARARARGDLRAATPVIAIAKSQRSRYPLAARFGPPPCPDGAARTDRSTRTAQTDPAAPANPRATSDKLPAGLYICCTPLGHLGDATHRLSYVLSSADIIAHERDLPGARSLLHALGIGSILSGVPIVKLPDTDEPERARSLASNALSSAVAVVTDAGSPCISDPGTETVHHGHSLGVNVVPIPGPSAAIAALSVSGYRFNSTGVSILGFLPRRSSERRRKLQLAASLLHAAVVFEASQRLADTLDDALASGYTHACVCREITKKHEEIIRGHIEEISPELRQRARNKKLKGELTVVFASPQETVSISKSEGDVTDAEVEQLMHELVIDEGKSMNTSSKEATELLGVKRKRAYNAGLRVQRQHKEEKQAHNDSDSNTHDG